MKASNKVELGLSNILKILIVVVIVAGGMGIGYFALTQSTTPAGAPEGDRTYGGPKTDYGYSMIQTSDGGYAIAGYSDSFGGISVYLVKTDSAGNFQWDRTYGETNLGGAFGSSVVQTSDGGYAIAGYIFSLGDNSGTNFYLVKADSAGNMEWNMTYRGPKSDNGYSIVQTSDGGYAIAGTTDSLGGGENDILLIKTDSVGELLWSNAYGGTEDDSGSSVVQTSDGGYAIAGTTNSFGAGSADFWLVKTDANGNMLWNMTYGGPNADSGSSVVQTSDGGYAITGSTYSFGAGNHDFWLVKTDEFGFVEWNQTYGGTEYDTAASLVATSDGGYAIAGNTHSFGAGSADFWLVKTDANGNMLWNMTYGGPENEFGSSVVQTSNGGYAIAGSTNSFGAGGTDCYLVKTDSTGNIP